jgi:nucleoside-diphosphate-sugar epimerase
MEQTSKIYIAGHRGMVGSGLERKLRSEGFNNIITRTSREFDLRNQQAVNDFFEKEKPEYVILAAAKVRGIHANNTYRAEFIYDNLMIEANNGTPRREFLHVDDLADACYFLLQNNNKFGLVNIGFGQDISIKDLAELIVAEVGYKGQLVFDTTKPDGTPRKLMNVDKLSKLGWNSRITLKKGIQKTLLEFNEKNL